MVNYHNFQSKINAAIENKIYGIAPTELYHPISYIMSLGGKRLRPLLTLVACDLFNGDVDKSISAATAIELFHNFTLIHDDLMDNAPLRRNNPTVHIKWNHNIAVLSGDAMMVCAYQELCKSEASKLSELLAIFNDTALKVCEGQQFDMNYEKTNKVSILNYLKMIELKTAVLLGASLKMGAILANANSEDANNIYNFGKHIGLAFQLQDDILDVYSNNKNFGKQKGGDIIANKKTFLLLKALEIAEGNRYMKEELNQWILAPSFDPVEKVEAVTGIFNFLNVKELASIEMQKQYNLALQYIKLLGVNEVKKQALVNFASDLMNREI